MLNKYRIGNDIAVEWSLLDALGDPVSLEDREDIEVELHVGSRVIPITDFQISENKISFVFLGATQIYTGVYCLYLRQANGRSTVTIDEFKIFVLVDHTWEASQALSTDFSVSIHSVMNGIKGIDGIDGEPAGFGEIDAEVDDTCENPTVTVETSGPDTAKNIHFIFTGINGKPAGFGTVDGEVDDTTGTPSVEVETSGEDTEKNIHFKFSGIKGSTGIAEVTAEVDSQTGTPSVEVETSGTPEETNIHFAFSGLKGEPGGGALDPTGFLAALSYDSTTNTWTLGGNFSANGNVSAGTASEEE